MAYVLHYQSDKYFIYIFPTYIPTQLLNAPVLNKMLCVQIVCIGMSEQPTLTVKATIIRIF